MFCKANNISAIEDEQHVLLQCSKFTGIRRDHFDHVRKRCLRTDSLCDENKFIYLLNSSGSTIKDIMITFPCNEHPLTPHFYIVKLGFTGVYIFSSFLL